MDHRSRRQQTNIFTEEQIKRVLIGSGITIESEVGSDFIIFCPYHNNTRTPAGEVSKESGLFFCFGCQQTSELQELIMKTTGRSYFESIRFIKSKEKETNIEPTKPLRTFVDVQNEAIQVLQTVYDPEIPVNIYELGLIYEVNVSNDLNIEIIMSLTSPFCPAAQSMPEEIKQKLGAMEGVKGVEVKVVFEPPWTQDLMSESAKLQLGFM